jgi:hypothetical protein
MKRKKSFIMMASGPIFPVENIELELTNRDEMKAKSLFIQAEMRRHQAEVDSAILSLKTNLSICLVLVLLYLSVISLANDILAVIFSVLKNMAPVVTIFVNFEKIRSLWSML